MKLFLYIKLFYLNIKTIYLKRKYNRILNKLREKYVRNYLGL